jgi:uncharacterized iron-regulated protein
MQPSFMRCATTVIFAALIAVTVLMASAFAADHAATAPETEAMAKQAKTPGDEGIWIDVYQGEPVDYEAVVSDLATADVVYLGERHTLARHHELQRRILGDLAQRGNALMLGLEQMESFQQPHLDRYNQGQIDFEQLAAATDWSKRWQNYAQYRPILDAAQRQRIPVVALNGRAETIRQVARRGGVDRLPPTMRKELPAEMHLQDPAYERVLTLQMMVHAAATPEMLRPMIEAQIVRDESMAAALAAFFKSQPGAKRTAIVLCGAGHVAYGLGTPERVRQRMPGVKDRVVLLSESGEVRLSPAEMAQARPTEITHEQLRAIKQPVADYLCIKPLTD